jgi:2-polyprenyl-3-methyl-5-hydroxy-6-metoxy-1,4-benzoquinol methylase
MTAPKPKYTAKARFDAAYYNRFYRNPTSRAHSPASLARKAQFIASYLSYLEIPVRRVIDVGCGLGWTLKALARLYPRATCHGVEYSPHLCQRYGWREGSVVDYRVRTPYDLVVCNDVLPSLDDAACARALENLATLCRGALFIGALTEEDWERCDKRRTDRHVYLRTARWYRRRLASNFVGVGGGVYLKKPIDITLWELDTP